MMMRASSGIVCAVAGALSFAVACSWGGACDDGSDAERRRAARAAATACAPPAKSTPALQTAAPVATWARTSVRTWAATPVRCAATAPAKPARRSTSCPSDCTGGGSGSANGNCPSDPTACFSCIIDPTMCPTGLDANSCFACIFGGLGSVRRRRLRWRRVRRHLRARRDQRHLPGRLSVAHFELAGDPREIRRVTTGDR